MTMEPPRKSDEEMQALRKRKSERRQALKEAHEELNAATQRLLRKLQAVNGKKPQVKADKQVVPDDAETEEQEA